MHLILQAKHSRVPLWIPTTRKDGHQRVLVYKLVSEDKTRQNLRATPNPVFCPPVPQIRHNWSFSLPASSFQSYWGDKLSHSHQVMGEKIRDKLSNREDKAKQKGRQ